MSKGDWTWIPQHATRRGITTPQLALCLDITSQTISGWLTGRADPSFRNLLMLAHIFCEDSVEKLAGMAGIDWRSLVEDLSFQAEALGVDLLVPALGEHDGPITFHLPLDVLQEPNALGEQFKSAFRSAADLLKYTGRFQELRAQASHVLSRMAGRDSAFAARLYYDVAYASLMLGNYPDGIRSTEKARALLAAHGDQMLLADTHWLSAECLRIIGELGEARRHCDEATRLYRKLKVKTSAREPGRMWVEWNLGCIDAADGRYDTARKHFTRLGAMGKRTGLPEAEISATWGCAYVDEMRSEFDQALEGYRQAQQLASRFGDRFWVAESRWRSAEVARKTSSFADATLAAQAARSAYASMGNESMMTKLSCTVAACHLQIGAPDKALALYRNAADFFAGNRDRPMERAARAGYGLALLALESQEPAPAYEKILRILQEIEAIGQAGYNRYLDTYEGFAHAEALRLAGYTTRALERYHNLAETSASLGHQLEKAHALLGIAETRRMTGQADRRSCHEALKIYRRVGSKWGQVHALITLALIALDSGESAAPLLGEASVMARGASLKADLRFIESLAAKKPAPGHLHVLLFV
ncbi:MAG TPA: helix-turn-helix transcriptional regulator [Anaerolineae bacterium]|nr:helix-turn-helix transcriptional regulator [Anaerolineae bacterium]